MFLALVSLLGCLDYSDLQDALGEDGGKKGGRDNGDDDDDDDAAGKGDRDEDSDRESDDSDRESNDENADQGGALEDTCATGVSAFCICGEAYGYPCSDSDMQALYDECLAGNDGGLFECMADFVQGNDVYCYDAVMTCLYEYGA